MIWFLDLITLNKHGAVLTVLQSPAQKLLSQCIWNNLTVIMTKAVTQYFMVLPSTAHFNCFFSSAVTPAFVLPTATMMFVVLDVPHSWVKTANCVLVRTWSYSSVWVSTEGKNMRTGSDLLCVHNLSFNHRLYRKGCHHSRCDILFRGLHFSSFATTILVFRGRSLHVWRSS